jgi:hypothetical protein
MAWTPEQKKAASERAKARYVAIQNKNLETKHDTNQVTRADDIQDEIQEALNTAEQHDPQYGPQPEFSAGMRSPDYGDIERMVEEMVQARIQDLQSIPQNYQPWQQQSPQISQQGQLVGVRDKYIMDPGRYPDPRERLASEQMLQRFAFKENYDLGWNIGVSSYQTKEGVNTREPKFTLQLIRVIFDEDTGLASDQRYVVCQAIFHEDPEAALAIATDRGYRFDDMGEKEFLDEMRYLRMRDWLLEAFYPPKPKAESRKKEVVIGNRVVEVFTMSSEQSETIPFASMKKASF